MRRLGLSDADLRAFHRGLVDTHERRIHVIVSDLDGNILTHLTPDVLDGQVMVDTTGEADQPTRILDLLFLDPSRSVHFEPAAPGDAPLHRSRVIQVVDSRRVPELADWIDVVVFTGVVWDFDRQGAEVTLVAHGMERQALGQAWKPVTYAKHRKKTAVIKDILAATGENALAGIPDLSARMPERMTIARMDSPWPRAKRLSASMDRQLFYPGNGRPVMRRLPSRPVFTFRDDRHLLSEVKIDRDPEGVFNTFVAVGSKAKGSKHRPQAVATLPPAHPLSPQSLARSGEPLRLVKREENRQIKSDTEAKARAERMADAGSRVLVNYSFDSIPIPHLDENDLVRVVTSQGTFLIRMEKWSLPLGFEGAPPMTVGDVRRTTGRRHRTGGGNQ